MTARRVPGLLEDRGTDFPSARTAYNEQESIPVSAPHRRVGFAGRPDMACTAAAPLRSNFPSAIVSANESCVITARLRMACELEPAMLHLANVVFGELDEGDHDETRAA